MVGCNARTYIRIKFLFACKRIMPVYHNSSFFCILKLVHNIAVTIDNARGIHKFANPMAFFKQLVKSISIYSCTIIFVRSSRNTARSHKHCIKRYDFTFFNHIIYARLAAYIGNFMRVNHAGCCSVA